MRWLLPLVLCAVCFALPPTFTVPARNPQPLPAGTSVAETNFIKQNFEGAGYDNSETWVTDGAGNPDATTTPNPPRGSQYLEIPASTSDGAGFTFAATHSSVVIEFLAYFEQVGANSGFFFLGTVGFGSYVVVQVNGGQQLTIVQSGGAIDATCADTISLGTWYHIWVRYTEAASGSVVASVAFQADDGNSDDDVEPTGGNKFAKFINGTVVFTPASIYFQGRAVGFMGYDEVQGWVP